MTIAKKTTRVGRKKKSALPEIVKTAKGKVIVHDGDEYEVTQCFKIGRTTHNIFIDDQGKETDFLEIDSPHGARVEIPLR